VRDGALLYEIGFYAKFVYSSRQTAGKPANAWTLGLTDQNKATHFNNTAAV